LDVFYDAAAQQPLCYEGPVGVGPVLVELVFAHALPTVYADDYSDELFVRL
jgi:hypothetical protein